MIGEPLLVGRWQNSLFSLSGALLVSCSVIWSSLKYILWHFFDLLVTKFLQKLKNQLPRSHHPPNSGHFWENGSKFWNSVESTWKYIKFATIYVKTGKNSDFDPWPPPYRLNQPTRTPTLTWKLVKWKKLNSRWCIWAKNWLRTRIWCILEIVVTDFQYFGFSPFRELFSAKISNFSLK